MQSTDLPFASLPEPHLLVVFELFHYVHCDLHTLVQSPQFCFTCPHEPHLYGHTHLQALKLMTHFHFVSLLCCGLTSGEI